MRQANAQLTDIAWLAGFMDGESNFRLAYNIGGGGKIYVRVGITNTSLTNIEKCERIVRTLVGRPGKRAYVWRGGVYKPRYDLTVTAQEEVRRLCLAIQPFVAGKGEHVRTMLRYLEIAPGHSGRKNGISRFGPEHDSLVAKMTELNRRHGPKSGSWSAARDRTAGPDESGEETIRPATQVAEVSGN